MDLNVKLVIDDTIINILTRLAKRKVVILTVCITFILASVILYAAVKPYTFTAGTTISSSQVNANFDAAFDAINNAVPVGTIIAYGGTSAPDGWLFCDGNSYSRTEYGALFGIIGTAFGTANSSSFNVPDLRGQFLRGRDGGAGIDPDRAARTALKLGGNTGDSIGSSQSDEIKSHNHATGGDGCGTTCGNRYYMADSTWTSYNTKNSGGNETRPINVYINFIIKY